MKTGRPAEVREAPRPARETLPALALLVAGYMVAVVTVDPLREFMTQDDGWAYARSVRHLLASGRYELDAWAAASMPVQVYLAAALSKLFGYSASLLRVQTLLLLAAGLAGYYALLRELLLRPFAAVLLSLVLLASPLVLMLAFTFMSDVQFMSWMVLAMWLYVRGLVRDSDPTIFAGSVMAACAIGTRQFGMAVIAAWIIVWCVARPARPSARRMLAAIALPVLMSVWQLRAGFDEPSFTQAVRLHEQAAFWHHSPGFMALEIGWRLATLLQYLGLLMLPLFPVMAALAIRGRRMTTRRRERRGNLLLACIALPLFAVIVSFWVAGSSMTTRPEGGRWLPLWWMLPNAFGQHLALMKFLTLAGLVGALLLIVLAIDHWPARERWRAVSPAWLLAAALGVCMVALHVVYLQLNDTYLVGLLPLALLLPARAMQNDREMSRVWSFASACLCLGAIVPLAWWMRGQYDILELTWRSAAQLARTGVDPRCIVSTRPWAEYHGGFDDWIAETYPRFERRRSDTSPAGPGSIHEDYWQWSDQRSRAADYLVSQPWSNAGVEWRVENTVEYSKLLLRHQKVVTYVRVRAAAGGAPTCAKTVK